MPIWKYRLGFWKALHLILAKRLRSDGFLESFKMLNITDNIMI